MCWFWDTVVQYLSADKLILTAGWHYSYFPWNRYFIFHPSIYPFPPLISVLVVARQQSSPDFFLFSHVFQLLQEDPSVPRGRAGCGKTFMQVCFQGCLPDGQVESINSRQRPRTFLIGEQKAEDLWFYSKLPLNVSTYPPEKRKTLYSLSENLFTPGSLRVLVESLSSPASAAFSPNLTLWHNNLSSLLLSCRLSQILVSHSWISFEKLALAWKSGK